MIIYRIRKFIDYAKKTLLLMIGVPDYGNYLEHMQEKHPEQTPMNYKEFFQNRQNARYGTGAGKCC